MIDRQKLLSYAEQFNISVTEDEAEKLDRYCELLIEKNKHLNLTSITDPDEVLVKHILDSLVCADLSYIKGRVADVGTGGGFPGVPLKIHHPECDVTLIDATGKKLNFIREACSELGIVINNVHGRAEELGRKQYRGEFDTVVARAVASLPVLCELCIPLVRTGGYFIAMKGSEGETELKAAAKAINMLGGSVSELINLELPDASGSRSIIVIKKYKNTPETYPRGGSIIQKKPL